MNYRFVSKIAARWIIASIYITALLAWFCSIAFAIYSDDFTANQSNYTANVESMQISKTSLLTSIEMNEFWSDVHFAVIDFDELNNDESEVVALSNETESEEIIEEEIIWGFEYEIQAGDSLCEIAYTIYGDSKYMYLLADYNDINNISLITVGDIIIIPDPDTEYEIPVIESTTSTVLGDWPSNPVSRDNKTGHLTSSYYPESISSMSYAGAFNITAYDAYCSHCCGKSNGITSSGTSAKAGRTCASNYFKAGTVIYIEGYGYYVVEDTGGMSMSIIDIVAPSHDECYKMTASNIAVYIVYQ